jgi:hypothetical protein
MPETLLEQLNKLHRIAGLMSDSTKNHISHMLDLLEEIEDVLDAIGPSVNQWRRDERGGKDEQGNGVG